MLRNFNFEAETVENNIYEKRLQKFLIFSYIANNTKDFP
jgi:hypothetical protein